MGKKFGEIGEKAIEGEIYEENSTERETGRKFFREGVQ